MRAILIAASLLALTACQTHIAEEETMPETCIAAELQAFVGQPLARLSLDTLPEPVRVIAPGMPVTMDYREERLNIEHDQNRVITRIFCG